MAIGERYDEILGAARDVIGRRGFHQASIREIARSCRLSIAGLYHYVAGKDELLFLVLDRSLDRLLAGLDEALVRADGPASALRALILTHLEFAFREPAALKIVNRDWELVAEPRRAEGAAKRATYLERGTAVLRAIDRHGRSDAELHAATNLLLGMLNGIATRAFLRSGDDACLLADEVSALFLHGFLDPDLAVAGGHDDRG